MAKHVCPVCGGTVFLAIAHIAQEWKIDSQGDFLDCLDECLETDHEPDDEDVWSCAKCGYDAPGKELLTDEN